MPPPSNIQSIDYQAITLASEFPQHHAAPGNPYGPGQEGFIGDNVCFSSFRPDDLRYAVCLDFRYSDTLDCDMIGRQSIFRSCGVPVRAVTE